MENHSETLSFLDLLDLDEYLIDSRLKTIITRTNYTNKHLSNALQLLRYKLLTNIREKSDCDNHLEYEFAAKLIKEINTETVELTCQIINTVLKLNTDNIVSNSEHLLQQILSNIDLNNLQSKDEAEIANLGDILLYLKVCDCILDAVLSNGLTVSLLLLEVPLENLINCSNKRVSVQFITSTVPRLFNGVRGYNILDKVWDHIKKLKGDNLEIALKALSSLSEYYLPITNKKESTKFESEIVKQKDFWNIVLYGLKSTDFTQRKISVYLAKRAIDYIAQTKCNVQIKELFTWKCGSNSLKAQWDNFFILIDSLEEKQSNIVLPSLQLFDSISTLDDCWLNCAFNLGLTHDNALVRLKCIEYRLKTKINNIEEAVILLKALDDFNFYDNVNDRDKLKDKLAKFLDDSTLTIVMKGLSLAYISPIPLFHISDVLANLKINVIKVDETEIVIDLFKIPCNVITMRKAVHVNLLQFASKFNVHWKALVNIVSLLHIDIQSIENDFTNAIKNIFVTDAEKNDFFDTIFSNNNIDFALLYFKSNRNNIIVITEVIYKKLNRINDIVSRQYSDKLECFNDVIFLLKLKNRCIEIENIGETINKVVDNEMKIIVRYITSLLSSDSILNVDETKLLFDNLKLNNNPNEMLLNIYKNCIVLLKSHNTEIDKVVLAMCLLNNLTYNEEFVKNNKQEMLDLKTLIDIVKVFENKTKDKAKSIGRVRNIFYEKHCNTIYLTIDNERVEQNIKEVVDYIENLLETGGYGCLKWILKVVNQIINTILKTNVKFDVQQFVHRVWKEIEELKTNHDYPICMKEFVVFITQDVLLEKSDYNNTLLLYYMSLIEYGSVKNGPLFYLVQELRGVDYLKYQQMVYVLVKMLLYCPVPRKDQRITDNLALEILKSSKFEKSCKGIDQHFNYEIQYNAISILTSIKNEETLDTITKLITNDVDGIFKSKIRYHGNSQIHRTLQTALQHLLFILLLKKGKGLNVMPWCMELLGKLPHQTSVRVCLEWYIAVCFYIENHPVTEDLQQKLKSKNVPLTSQFNILFWLLKHKLINQTFADKEYEYVLDMLLSHTMGQMFNIRLQSQYLATLLYSLHENIKYAYTIKIINRTLKENSNDKNFVKLKADYFANSFDVLANLNPYFIYYVLPRICDVGSNEFVDLDYVKTVTSDILKEVDKRDGLLKVTESFVDVVIERNVGSKLEEDVEINGTLQKKYIPWNSMSDVDVYEVQKKRESPSDLIVVASLIDKLPNLGGMARTSEVFGVKTYVIDSLRHLQDRQFQGLSVSAERWIDVAEVRPGQALKEYLNARKAEGYCVVAAEQTSTSAKLQQFKFPRKTILLLGHEKEGVPCDLLPLMDHCIEIPQQGFVRSLNVHVTAAIFVWEYARQHLL